MVRHYRFLILFVFLGLLPAFGCEALISDPGEAARPDPDVPPIVEPDPDVDGDGIPDPVFTFSMIRPGTFTGVRMMTTAEYARTVAAVTGVEPDVNDWPAPQLVLNLPNDATRVIVRDALHMQQFLTAATDVANRVNVDGRFPCGDPCSDADLSNFVESVTATVPTSEMVSTYRTVYTDARAEKGHDFARRAVLQTLLISPHFLYRTEIGDGERLAASELVRKLSYFLWGLPPDKTLLDAAGDGSILTDEAYAAEVDRMVAHENTRAQVQRLFAQWLGVDHFDLSAKEVAAELPAGIQGDMEREFAMHVDDVIFEREAPLRELFTFDTTFANEALANLYGISGVTGGEFQTVSLEGTQRRGLLTTALVLGAHGKENGRSPMQRGNFLLSQVMCHSFPSEAGLASMELPEASGDETFRERFEPLSSTQPCSSCHRTLNAGFALDIFDTVGRRWDESVVPLSDASGRFDMAPFESIVFSNALEAIDGIAAHPAVPRCFVAQTFRFAMGRAPASQDRASVEQLFESFDSSDQDVLQLLRDLALSAPFRNVLDQ